MGLRSLTVDSLVYRQVCTNGLVRMVKNRSVFKRKHIGRRPDDLVAQLMQSAALALNLSTDTMEAFARATQQPLTDPVEQLKKLADPWDISDKVQASIIRQLSEERSPDTVYGLVNAITSVAQSHEPESRFRLESMAGAFLI